MKKTMSLVFSLLIIAVLAVILLKTQIYRVSLAKKLPVNYQDELTSLAKESLITNDLPVGALLLYDYSVIGKGYNTVIKNNNAGGHAVINAISDAINKMGFAEFSKLDKVKLEIITTFEPCVMCKGALEQYGISEVTFIKGRSLTHWLNEELDDFLYEVNKKRAEAGNMQDSLFQLHPAYEGE